MVLVIGDIVEVVKFVVIVVVLLIVVMIEVHQEKSYFYLMNSYYIEVLYMKHHVEE